MRLKFCFRCDRRFWMKRWFVLRPHISFRRRGFWSVPSVFTCWNVTISNVLGKATITVGTWNASVFLLWHLFRHFNCFGVNLRITTFFSKFHLAGYFNRLLNCGWLLSPVCFERASLWFAWSNFFFLSLSLWSTLTHGFVLKNFFRYQFMTITAFIGVDRFRFSIINIPAGIQKAAVTFLWLNKLLLVYFL